MYESDLWFSLKQQGLVLDHEQHKQFVHYVPYKNGKIDFKILNELIFEYFKDSDIVGADKLDDFEEEGRLNKVAVKQASSESAYLCSCQFA